VAPAVGDAPTHHQQLRTRPPTDDAVLPGHASAPDRRHSRESAQPTWAEGTLIHHATARAIGPLPVTMIETTFRTLLMASARRSHTGAPSCAATRRRAVDVAAIAGRTNAKRLCTRSTRAHPKRRLHEAAAPSARPRPPAAFSGRMQSDWFGLPQRRVGHEGLEVALQVLTLAQPPTPYLRPLRRGITSPS
jgi:hypothetical protein